MADHKKQNEHTHKSHEEHLREEHLMLDPMPRGEMNAMVMESMNTTFPNACSYRRHYRE